MRPTNECMFCKFFDDEDCLNPVDCNEDYSAFELKCEVYYLTPENELHKSTEHICLSCKQCRDNCPPYSADFANVYACVKFEAGVKNKEEYPHIIKSLIRTINEIGLDKITYIQTSVLEVTDHEIPQTQHQYINHIEKIIFENDVVLIRNSWGIYCLKMERIIGFGIKRG